MSDDNKDAELRSYNDDPRTPCQYGVKCYQKNPQHHSKYKHPSKKEEGKNATEACRNLLKVFGEDAVSGRTCRRWFEKFEAGDFDLSDKARGRPSLVDNDIVKIMIDEDSFLTTSEIAEKLNSAQQTISDHIRKQRLIEKNTKNIITGTKRKTLVEDDREEKARSESPQRKFQKTESSTSKDNSKVEDTSDVAKKIMNLFLVEMPKDFFEFYEFCKSISNNNPLMACKAIRLKLVGPYDVLENRINCEDENDKEKYLTHWRYYYDPPEFQTVLKFDDKEGLHFGYWRDDATEKPVFVAKNRANVNCVFEPVAENIFGAVDSYLQDKMKSANPFEKMGITRLHSQLKNYAKQHNISLEKNTLAMKLREKQIVARTFHRAGIVVPYDKKTQTGYRDLAATDSDLQKILKQIEEADTTDERKPPMAKLDEIMRLATIAADECDFGTCLELGHDLFSNGGVHVQSRALNMLSIAYTHLQRPQLLKIVKAHLKDRKKGCDLSVI